MLLIALLTPLVFVFSHSNRDLPKTLDEYRSQSLSWERCYTNFECADLSVPINYQELSAGRFSIKVLRVKARNQRGKLGSLVINPGGPGASGVNYAYNADSIFDAQILNRYDIVGFDPRGIGASSAIHCLTDKESDANYASDSKPDSPAELNLLVKEMRTYVAKCEAFTPNIAHFGTIDAARDLDLLRSALGEKKLNFLGVSYGTYLGTLYADLFPKFVGRMVLDGAVSPRVSTVEQDITQAVGFDHALVAFIQDCYRTTDCPLSQPLATGIAEIESIFSKAAQHPLAGTADRPVTESLVVLGVASALYDSASGWPQLRAAIAEANKGDGTTLLALSDEYSQRDSNGVYGSNEADASFVINCLDSQEYLSTAQIQSEAPQFALRAPIFGPYLAYSGLPCQFFTGISAGGHPISTVSSAPIVIVGTTRDPATPYTWALDLQKTLLGSRLITLIGDGHTGYGHGSECVDGAVDKYFLTGLLPKKGLTCKSLL